MSISPISTYYNPYYQNRVTQLTQPQTLWGENIYGVKTRLYTQQPVIALTFDACGSVGDGYNQKLINYLRQENIPATLFLSGRWIDKNPTLAFELARNPLFEIENHGQNHLPATIHGYSIYGISGPQSVQELTNEIESNAQKIQWLTGRRPQFYRPGTAFWEPQALQIAEKLGHQGTGFSVLGDKGATYSGHQIAQAVGNAKSGDIVIMHMNHPEKETLQGLQLAVTHLKNQGFKFVKLTDYPLC